MLREDLPAVGFCSQLVVVFTLVAEQGGVLSLIAAPFIIGYAAGLRLDAVVVVIASLIIVLGRGGVDASESEV